MLDNQLEIVLNVYKSITMAEKKAAATGNLVIVESPAKAKTIEGFLGKDFTVRSSYGHIRDLPMGDKAVDIKNNFIPRYEISEDKQKVVDELKKLAKKSATVWLATDEDREGEAISWHLAEALGLDFTKTKRIVFHEITKKAIQHAIENPRTIDKNLVDAQQARRILDRLVGFELSPILWKKIKPNLSAGRVQSVAVRLIVEREREVYGFQSSSSFRVVGFFAGSGSNGQPISFKAELSQRFPVEADAMAFLERIKGASFSVKNIEKKPVTKSPAAPFTTSTLQQEASRKLGFSVAQTMMLAQHLYESGQITYMRTDSVNLSEFAQQAAKEEVTKSFGEAYAFARQFKTKSASAQEAHEAIRPTYFENHSGKSDDDMVNRLYDLIWKRAIASQMANADIEKTIVSIINDRTGDEFAATGEVIRFEGFLKVYLESTDEEDQADEEQKEGNLPQMEVGQGLQCAEIRATQKFALPPPRYTEASLVKKLEALGIGRPSTYAPTISTIQKRGYVEKDSRPGKDRNYSVLSLKKEKITAQVLTEITGAEKYKLFPTDIGTVVNDFLVEHFKEVMDYNFTASVEEDFDEIAEGKVVWNNMIRDFYIPFHKSVEKTTETSERASGERELGLDPKTSKKIIARIGRFGPMVQLGPTEGEEKPRYAKLKKGQYLETITLEEALDLFKMPRNIGEYDGGEAVVSIGRFGPYILYKDAFYSLPKGDDPYTIEIDRAIEVIEEKKKANAEKILKTFPENDKVSIQKGRWGPYLVFERKNIPLPKGSDPLTLSFADCEALSKDFDSKPKKKTGFRK